MLFKLFRVPRSVPRKAATTCRLALETLEVREVLATYNVGPGLAQTSVNAVPWEKLGPGDIVRIHWRPEAYREKILISTSGTAQEPIRVIGVAGPKGELPVIDGRDATTRSAAAFPFAGTQDRGLVTITRDASHAYGFKPSHIQIVGLDLRQANKLYSFTAANGTKRTYTDNAASIFVERGEHVVIKNCVLTGSGNGLFVASGDEEATLSRDILVTGNNIYGNGNVGSDRHHNVYTAASGMVFEYNHFGELRPGALGGGLKDRSAGTVIRYNWIEGGARLIDLVDPEDNANLMTREPGFRDTYVYGNVLLNRPEDASTLIHYGGDSGVTSGYRKGTLHFYNNTVVVEVNQQQYWNTALLELDTNDERAVLDNNLIFTRSATAGVTPTQFNLVKSFGTIQVGANWITPGWLVSSAFGGFKGTVGGTNNVIPAAGASTDPGFVNLAGRDFRLVATSSAVDKSRPVAGALAVNAQYVATASGGPRLVNGTALDLGAFESTGGAVPVTNAPPRVATAARASAPLVQGTSVALSVLGADDAGEGSLTYHWTSAGPQTVTFRVDGTNAAKSTVATFKKAGVYTFRVTVRDAGGLTATSNVTVTVAQAFKSIVVTPATVTLRSSASHPFTASARDQFGDALQNRPVILWSLAPGSVGTLNRAGLYTAPAAPSGSAVVRATSGSVRGEATVMVSNATPGTLQFAAPGFSISEDAGAASITVTRTGGSSGAVTVRYATSDGTARDGIDYTATSGTLSFPAGVTSRTFTIPIPGGTRDGTVASLNLTLSGATGGANLGARTTAVLTIVGRPIPGATLFVDARNATGVIDGSALRPFTTVQAAVNAAGAGATVVVAAGTYRENITIPDKSVTLRGGYAGGTSAGYAGGQAGAFSTSDPRAFVTTILAANRQVPVIHVENATAKTVGVEGFTVSGGNHGIYVVADYQQFARVVIAHNIIENNGPAGLQPGGGAFIEFGGGIYSVNATVTIRDNVIRNNHANRGGGLFLSSGSDYTVIRNVIDGNTGWDDHGGGVFLVPLPITAVGNGTFSRNTIRNNVASKAHDYGWGGGILIPGNLNPASLKPVTLSYNTWTGNFAPSAGGAIFADDGATVVLDHELIYKNRTQTVGGGAIYVDGDNGGSGSFMTILDCIVADNFNAGDNRGNGVYVEQFSRVTVNNSIFWGNTQDFYVVPGTQSSIVVTNTDTQQGWPGAGNYTRDPRFTNPDAGDYTPRW